MITTFNPPIQRNGVLVKSIAAFRVFVDVLLPHTSSVIDHAEIHSRVDKTMKYLGDEGYLTQGKKYLTSVTPIIQNIQS